MMTGQPLLRPKLTHRAGFENSCLNKTTVRRVNPDTLYYLQANQYVVLTPICCIIIHGKASNTIRMTSTPLTITPLRR